MPAPAPSPFTPLSSRTSAANYNCLSGAFENAVHTLQSRAAQFGAQSAVVKAWIAAQHHQWLSWKIYRGGYVPEPAFLSEQDKKAAADQVNALATLPSSPRWLGQLAIQWAKAHPDAARVPESLHLAVRAWRLWMHGNRSERCTQLFERSV